MFNNIDVENINIYQTPDSNRESSDKDTIIYHLIRCNATNIINSMVKMGVNFNIHENYNTPLVMAINMKNDLMIDYFLEFGQYINITDLNGSDIITLAIKNRNIDLFKKLLIMGLDFNRHREPYDYSITPIYEVIRDIKEISDKPWLMCDIVHLEEMLKLLIEHGVNPCTNFNEILPKGKPNTIGYSDFIKKILKINMRSNPDNIHVKKIITDMNSYVRKFKIKNVV